MITNLSFYIHYCNIRRFKKPRKITTKMTRSFARSLQHHEFIYVCNGNGCFTVGGKRYAVKKGMLLYIRPDEPYAIEIDANVPSAFLTVHFSYANVTFIDGKWSIKEEAPALPLDSAHELTDAYPIEEQFRKLADCWNAKLPGYEFAAKTILQQLIISITQNLNKQPRNFAVSLKVEKIIEYMHQNINHKISVPELSEIVQMTPAYMSRAFKATTGYTIIEYFNRLKIDTSKEMLIDGNKKVKEIARQLGFFDEFYFSKIFKKIEGISPTEFYSRIVNGI